MICYSAPSRQTVVLFWQGLLLTKFFIYYEINILSCCCIVALSESLHPVLYLTTITEENNQKKSQRKELYSYLILTIQRNLFLSDLRSMKISTRFKT